MAKTGSRAFDPGSVPRASPEFQRVVGELYPVISFDIDHAAADDPTGVDVDAGAMRALATLAAHSKTPLSLTCWCREAPGFNRHNEPTELFLIYLAGKRVSGRTIHIFCEALNGQWPGLCRQEGSFPAEGLEVAMWGLHEGKVVRHQ
jgi:hypothetical protein